MRRSPWVAASVFALVCASACFDSHNDCAKNPYACYEGGSGGGVPATCTPSDPAWTPSADCGVFVSSSGAPGAAGTPGAPVDSIAEALAKAAGKPVFVCTTGLAEAVTLDTPAILFGGVDCTASWAYSGERSPLTAAAGEIPLVVAAGAAGSLVEDLDITASDAVGVDPVSLQGASSIAIWAEGELSLERVRVAAGHGADGANATFDPALAADGQDGNPGEDCGGGTGGAEQSNLCGGMTALSVGGAGGDGVSGPGEDGAPGLPDLGGGQAGLGNTGVCAPNGDGKPGVDGPAGTPGAGGSGLGSFAGVAQGLFSYAGPPGDAGGDGVPGQGGGGGGSKTAGMCMPAAGAGSGGSGGCPGQGGRGGGAGGGSFAIFAIGATVHVASSVLVVELGGLGGAGAAGQLGGNRGLGAPGGLGSTALSNGCAGGNGGNGGTGGPGGGGRGGPSAPFLTAVAGAVDQGPALSFTIPPSGAAGGPGGAPMGEPGADGQHTEVILLP